MTRRQSITERIRAEEGCDPADVRTWPEAPGITCPMHPRITVQQYADMIYCAGCGVIIGSEEETR